MSGFEPGDVVVCVSTTSECCGKSPCPCCVSTSTTPVVGQYYRVDAVGEGQCICGAAMMAFAPVHPVIPEDRCWPQANFRKESPNVDIFSLIKTKEEELT